ncbi:MAG: hypothetical protein ABUK01_14005 [Leptospirales bacterium]
MESKSTIEGMLKDTPIISNDKFTLSRNVIIKSNKNHTADFTFQKTTGEVIVKYDISSKTRKTTLKFNEFVMEGVHENSTWSNPIENTESMCYYFAFALPDKPAEHLEFYEREIEVPWNVNNLKLKIKGKMTTTLTGYVEIDNRAHAKLQSIIKINEVEIPDDAEDKMGCSVNGTSVFYFDIYNRTFHSGTMAVHLDCYSKAMKIESDGNESLDIRMEYDHLFTFDRLE